LELLKNVKAEMSRHGKTNADMAKLLGMSENSFSFKLNERREFSLTEARKIAELFKVSVDYIAGFKQDSSFPEHLSS
jgi:DNA-binding XRE family transcriptional regulator